MNAKCYSAHWIPGTHKRLWLRIWPLRGLVSFKGLFFACVLFMAQRSRNSRRSVLPQLVPLRRTIHAEASWVASRGPLWLPSRWFMGRQLIYPLYTFQVTGVTLQGDRRGATAERKKGAKTGGKTGCGAVFVCPLQQLLYMKVLWCVWLSGFTCDGATSWTSWCSQSTRCSFSKTKENRKREKGIKRSTDCS